MISTGLHRPLLSSHLLCGFVQRSARSSDTTLLSASFFTQSSKPRIQPGSSPISHRPLFKYRLRAGAASATALAGGAFAFSSSSSPSNQSSAASQDQAGPGSSSSLLREASPSARRKQTVSLVFLSTEGWSHEGVDSNLASQGRKVWHSWIGYFREAGYDCFDTNVCMSESELLKESKDQASVLSDELHTQLRLQSLQRAPVLFVHGSMGSSAVAARYVDPSTTGGSSGRGGGSLLSKIFSSGGARPLISGLVVLSPPGQASQAFSENPKLMVLLVGDHVSSPGGDRREGKVQTVDTSGKSQEEVIKEVERWLIRQGFEG
ncbi:hypothetical protein IE53DRAFT_407895 [Violaceomyces palustris]|uniref:Uncharacterized protein n=1 Tax=Violaceomyces palustris TaxID=1673888 RepID=A0ACD0P8T4_9BASI|nr:hypothetical protein IE53DRAFT_407895 [Violaceomyces palustris]